MSDPSLMLFERFGGAEGVAEIVRKMYDRILADPELAPFFKNVTMDRLHKMQFQFMASALDGPVDYTGAELTAIHRGRGITDHHFAKFCGHFADAAEEHGIGERDIDDALARLAMFKDKITGDVGIDG